MTDDIDETLMNDINSIKDTYNLSDTYFSATLLNLTICHAINGGIDKEDFLKVTDKCFDRMLDICGKTCGKANDNSGDKNVSN